MVKSSSGKEKIPKRALPRHHHSLKIYTKANPSLFGTNIFPFNRYRSLPGVHLPLHDGSPTNFTTPDNLSM